MLCAIEKGRWKAGFSSNRPIKLALVEDQSEILESWIKLINGLPGFACSCSCATEETALLTIPQEQPDVVLMGLPPMSGLQCTVRLKKLLPNVRVVVFAVMDDQESVIRALVAGADGYLLKRTSPTDLRTALLDVLHNGAPMTSQIALCVVAPFRHQVKIPDESMRPSLMEERILFLRCVDLLIGLVGNCVNIFQVKVRF